MSADEPPGAVPAHGAGSGNGHDSAGSPRPAWWIYQGTGRPLPDIRLADLLPEPPPWRRFNGEPISSPPPSENSDADRRLGPVANLRPPRPDRRENDAVNAALYLRRPLLVTGRPGVGKSTLAHKISRELRLGRVLKWSISSQSTLTEALYRHDPIARVQDSAAARTTDPPGIGAYLKLGPLGTALLPFAEPRVLLIDEFDKGDIDLPNDLLNVLEDGEYEIPELERIAGSQPEVEVHTDDPDRTVTIRNGRVRCRAFPFIVITSNGEREFPSAFLRRCLHFAMEQPDEGQLADMVAAHFADSDNRETAELIDSFLRHREVNRQLTADQLLNAVYLTTWGGVADNSAVERVLEMVWNQHRPEAAVE
jgi:MoxR-like ATPase